MNLLRRKKDLPSHNAYAVVTGAGSGIGRSFALEISRRRGVVVCADLKLEGAQETVRLIEAQGGKAFAVACDVGRGRTGAAIGRAGRRVDGAPRDFAHQQRRRWGWAAKLKKPRWKTGAGA